MRTACHNDNAMKFNSRVSPYDSFIKNKDSSNLEDSLPKDLDGDSNPAAVCKLLRLAKLGGLRLQLKQFPYGKADLVLKQF